MTTTATRLRRRLGVVLAGSLAVGGLVALAPTATAAQTGPVAGTGLATWGLSDYLNSANVGRPNPKSDYYGAPATFTAAVAGPPAVPALSTFGEGSGTVNATTGAATLSFKGTTVNWATTGNQWLTLTDPIATFDGTGAGTVSALVEYGATTGTGTEAERWAARTVTSPSQRVTIVDLSPTAEAGDATYPTALGALSYTFNPTTTKYSWSGLKGRWTEAFMTHLVGNYTGTRPAPQTCVLTTTCWGYSSTVVNTVSSGVSRYPSEFTFSIDRQVASTTATPSVDGDGVKIAVAGTGFLKTSPGVYVSLRERTTGDAAYAGGSLAADAPTAWVSNNASDIGPDPATGAASSIAEDGSFSVDVKLDATAAARLDPTKSYTIVTRKAHGQGASSANASQVTETPVDIAALKQTTTVAAASVSTTVGSAAVVNATVTPATDGTPSGTVTVLDGSTVVGTGTLAGGTTAISVTGLPVGTKSYDLRYAGAPGYWKSSGTVSITVAKRTTAITVAGAATVAYRTASTYTATVSNGATGSVVLTGAGAAITKPIVGGKATFSLPTTLTAGKKALKFAYAGSESNSAAPSVTKSVTVSKGAATIGLTVVRKATAVKAGRVTVTVRSTKGGPVPTGKVTVSFTKGSVTKTLTAKVLANGKVTFDLPRVPKGTWTLKLGYQGSTQHSAVTRSIKLTVAAK